MLTLKWWLYVQLYVSMYILKVPYHAITAASGGSLRICFLYIYISIHSYYYLIWWLLSRSRSIPWQVRCSCFKNSLSIKYGPRRYLSTTTPFQTFSARLPNYYYYHFLEDCILVDGILIYSKQQEQIVVYGQSNNF